MAIPYPGASPDGVEKEVLDPVEEAISAISGVKTLNGRAEDGFATIFIEFVYDKPLAEATQDIRDAISAIRSDLPTEMKEPIIKKQSDTDRPIVSLALTSNVLNSAQLTRLADPGITRELRAINGVGEVAVLGKIERELTVQIKPTAMQAAGVSVGEVVAALQMQNLAAPVGRLTGTLDEKSIRLKGRLADPQEFGKLVVSERNGQLIRLSQVADILDGTEEARTVALYNDKEAVGIDVKKSQGYSTTDVSSRILDRAKLIEKRLPKGVQMEIVKNSGQRVENAVRNVEETLLEGALLTVLVVFLFLNSWRSTVITGLALPVSVLASFIAVWALGFKLETMSLLGLSLAIGILIDDAIVVRENIVRHVEMGKDHLTAAREGTDEIGLAVAATTFSILAVFVPIGFMPGLSGQWFKPFALTIACSVFVSLFVSFSLDPMLSAYWADPHQEEHQKAWITKVLDKFNHWFNRQSQNYKRVIGWALDHRKSMVAIALGTFVFALSMPVLRLVGVSFFPVDDRAELNMKIETPPGSNLEYTRLKTAEAVAIVRAHPEVRYTYATLGGGTTSPVDEGNVFIRMTPKEKRALSADNFASTLRDEMTRVSGATISVFTNDFGGGRKQLQMQVRGDDPVAINQSAELIFNAMKKVPGVVDLGLSSKGQKPELNVELDRTVAGNLGITVGQVAQALRPAFAGIKAGDWQDPSGEMREVNVRLSPEARTRATDLKQLPLTVRQPDGSIAMVPLGQVSSVAQSVGPAAITHLNRDLVVTVEANTSIRPFGEVSQDVQTAIAKLNLPSSVRVTPGGDTEQQNEVFGNIFLSLGTAIVLMYLILVMQFGSFLDPIAIMLSLPLSLIGVMLALAITGSTINLMSLI
ncbi:MAG: efflux RND transporter permease subunit, partial [Gemmatimonadaceae bacterium]